MSDKYKLFRSSLTVPVFETYNKAIFNLLHSPKYENYTDVVFSTLGQELENFFEPEEMKFKYRYKSIKSFNNNIKKDSKIVGNIFVSNFNKYISYDIIGMKLVINKVSPDFKISQKFIDECKRNLELTKQQLFELENNYYAQNNSNNSDFFKDYSSFLKHKMEYLENCCNFNILLDKRNETQKKLLTLNKNKSKDCKKEIETAKTLLNNLNNTLCMIAGNFAIEYVINNSPKLKKLGIYLNYDRKKFFYDDTGYTSVHCSIESSILPGWISEFQTLSSEIDYWSKYEKVTHDSIPGKKRKLENLPTQHPNFKLNGYLCKHNYRVSKPAQFTKSVKNFLERLDFVIPHYTKYIKNGYIRKYTKPENVHHYYKKLLLENPKYESQLKKFLEKSTNEEFLPTLNGNKFMDKEI